MATIRAEGERKSWSEQNKERVWAAVTSCLTNVPPTLLRAVAAAAGAAAEPAGGRATRGVAWGGFLATRGPESAQLSTYWESPPAQPREPGQEHCSPPLASLASLASSPGAPQLPGLWTVGSLSRILGPKGRGHEAPAPQGRAPAPRGTSPSALAAVRSTPGQAGSCDASLRVRGRRRGLLGRSQSLLPSLLAPQASSFASQDAAASTLTAAQLKRLQSCKQVELASLPTCGRTSRWLVRHRLFPLSASPASPPTDAASPTECSIRLVFPPGFRLCLGLILFGFSLS